VFPIGNTVTQEGAEYVFCHSAKKQRPPSGSQEKAGYAVDYLGFQDLVMRWPVYTARGIRKLVHRHNFPVPVFTLNQGHDLVWREEDIVHFERTHPEMHSEYAKQRKIRGCAAAALKRATDARRKP
jgi:hypothetical protein